MKKGSIVFLIILSLILLLFISCGIPNYFGNIKKYVRFDNSHLIIEEKEFSDGFNPRDVEPKVMFLYTIYSHDHDSGDISTNTVKDKLSKQFQDEFKLSEYDFRGCSNAGNEPVVTVAIKDQEKNEQSFGLYQFKTMEKITSTDSYTSTPTNYSNDYLFNKDNMEFRYNKNYDFKYELNKVDDNHVSLVISCIDEDDNVVAAYAMGNYNNEAFLVNDFKSSSSADLKYAGADTHIYVLPVLYLESSKYSNRQMMTASWKSIELQMPKEPEAKPEIEAGPEA